MSEVSSNGTERPEDEWEVGVRRTDTQEWEHYHPVADTIEEAKEKALDEAKGIGLNTIAGVGDPIEVYMVAGPFKRSVSTGNR